LGREPGQKPDFDPSRRSGINAAFPGISFGAHPFTRVSIFSTRAASLILRQTDIASKVSVSTVFLGADHNYNFSGRGPPMLSGTMIFGGHHNQHQRRYTSRADVLKGHEAAVEIARGGVSKKRNWKHRGRLNLPQI
jgi:hypothetical protein